MLRSFPKLCLLKAAFLALLFGCAPINSINKTKSNLQLVEIGQDRTFAFLEADSTSTIDTELLKGTVVFYEKSVGDFAEVYIKDYNGLTLEAKNRYKIYVPKSSINPHYSKRKLTEGLLYQTPYDSGKTYITGPKGGCYYINTFGNKSYVSRAYCGSRRSYFYNAELAKYKSPNVETKTTTKRKTSGCRTVQCSGRTKKGSRCKRKTSSCSGRCHSH